MYVYICECEYSYLERFLLVLWNPRPEPRPPLRPTAPNRAPRAPRAQSRDSRSLRRVRFWPAQTLPHGAPEGDARRTTVTPTNNIESQKGGQPARAQQAAGPTDTEEPPHVGLYKILFHFKASLWQSIILLLPPPPTKAYPIAILLHDHCAIHARPLTPPVYAIHHTIFVMAISCKGQTSRHTHTRRLDVLYLQVGLYKIFVYLLLCVQESILPLLPPPICMTHTTAILLRDFCAIDDLPPTLPGYAIHHTILVMTISCKG